MKGLTTKFRDRDVFEGQYKKYDIFISRDDEREGDFYIQVYSDIGYLYDGWWNDSANATIDQAIEEALNGSMLATNSDSKEGK